MNTSLKPYSPGQSVRSTVSSHAVTDTARGGG
jgi:hypothetical protein